MATRTRIKVEDESPKRERVRVEDEGPSGPSYFASGADKENLLFTSSGCALVDEALGGGPVLGRVINVVGDRSSGKTLLAMEIMAQTLLRYSKALARYGEAEAAWDREYAEALGIPVDQIQLNKEGERIETVEQWAEDLEAFMVAVEKAGHGGVYVLDSLDAISDDDEMKADFGEASFGGKKPKLIGQLFRRYVGRLEQLNILLVVVSQLRDKIGVTFGETKTRSGGKALDYYATHILWLREIDKIKKTFLGQERVLGFNVEAHCKKNKVGLAFRKARYPLLFGYGIDDLTASVEWLIDIGQEKRLHKLGMRKDGAARARTKADVKKGAAEELSELVPYPKFLEEVRAEGGQRARDLRQALTEAVRYEWARIETELLPKGKKY